ncbi:LAFE_0G13718g1_1 [Lachancea fermentati]|uniref:LAFE_0G13718g1_1 n=1 Tax=Lachancea fermentati TaxID=4955 RepID=A0A1G4MIA0_LACFM|nr:LAFE_0G13718g1_1 [Lachancea fermentati]
MTGANGHGNQNINIVNSNYSRYGTSVYQKLYKETSPGPALHGQVNWQLDKMTSFASTESSLTTDNDSTTSKFKKKYRSLLQNYGGSSSKAKRLIGKLHDHGSSDSFSIFSLRSSYSNRNLGSGHQRAPGTGSAQQRVILEDSRPFLDLNALPAEILVLVFQNLDRGGYLYDKRSLVRCLYVCKKFYEAGKAVLYESPCFVSTYRFAQFVTCLRLHPENGLLLRVLDLSRLKSGLIEEAKEDDDEEEEEDEAEEDEGDEQEWNNDERDEQERRGRRMANDNVLQEENEEDAAEEGQELRLTEGTHLERESTPTDDDLPGIAWAGWRDWRFRFDPLYGSQMLNSYYNLKRSSSRSSSITSTGTAAASTVPMSRRAHRSNSSVSSFTSSIMSSFYNSTSLSSLNLTLSQDSPSSSGSNKWFRNIFNSKRAQKRKYEKYVLSKMNDSTKDLEKTSQSDDEERKTSVKFCVQKNLKDQPFHEGHPYTNKFLLKYSLYKDVPMGHIFHVISHCPNIVKINLANVTISSDFQVVVRNKATKCNTISMLRTPKEQEKEVNSNIGKNLDVVYLTDSNKNYDYYQGSKSGAPKRVENLHMGSPFSSHGGEFWYHTNYPPPINQNTKYRGERVRSQNTDDYSLTKLEVRDLFSLLHDTLPHLKSLNMDNVVWCNQPDFKDFVLSKIGRTTSLEMSFRHAGMGRNLSWASQGNIMQFVAIILLGELLDNDDLYLEDLFNVRMERFSTPMLEDYTIIERSNLVTLYHHHGETKFSLLIKHGPTLAASTEFRSDSILECTIFLGPASDSCDEITLRTGELAHRLVDRIRDLRTAELRRHIGENQYSIGIV